MNSSYLGFGTPPQRRQSSLLVYRPPNGSSYEKFFEVLSQNKKRADSSVIVGDFNCHLEIDCPDSIELRSLVKSSKFGILDTGLSFHEYTDSWLDVVIVDDTSKVIECAKSAVPFIDFHDSFLLKYCFNTNKPKSEPYVFRNFKRCNLDKFTEDVCLTVRTHLENIPETNIDNSLLEFNLDLQTVLDTHAPISSVLIKPNYKPWFNQELKLLFAKRNRFYKIFKKTASTKYKKIYKIQAKLARTLDRKLEKQYFTSKFEKVNNAEVFKLLGRMGFQNPRSSSKSALNYFPAKDIVDYIAQTYSVHPSCSVDQLRFVLANVPIPNPTLSFSFHHFTFAETLSYFKKALLKSKGNSPDSIKLRHLSEVIPQISTFFTKYYNNLLDACKYPAIWKRSCIVPLLKKPRPESCSDIRPITNICHCAKPFDSLIAAQMSSYFEQNNFYSSCQSGFRMGFSTHTILAKLVNDVRDAINNNQVTILILYDFRKAFNSINHFLLLKLLRSLGFSDSAITFLFEYLSGRSIFTEGAHDASTSCGVGQGSGPGGHLFLILINTIIISFLFAKVLLFVDDAQGFLHVSVPEINQGIQKINVDSAALVRWASENGLRLNPDKTQAIILGSRHNLRQIKQTSLQPLLVDGQVVPLSTCIENLGLKITENLSWEPQLTDVITTTNRILFFLNAKGRDLPITIKKRIAAQLLFPHFDYACSVYIDLTKDLETRLERQLSKAIRFIFNLSRRTSATPFRSKLKWLSLSQRRKYFLLCLTYKALHLKKPPYLYSILKPNIINYETTLSAQTRNRPFFRIPSKTSKTFDASFSIAAMKSWNDLNPDIRDSENIEIFKSKIKNILLLQPL